MIFRFGSEPPSLQEKKKKCFCPQNVLPLLLYCRMRLYILQDVWDEQLVVFSSRDVSLARETSYFFFLETHSYTRRVTVFSRDTKQ